MVKEYIHVERYFYILYTTLEKWLEYQLKLYTNDCRMKYFILRCSLNSNDFWQFLLINFLINIGNFDDLVNNTKLRTTVQLTGYANCFVRFVPAVVAKPEQKIPLYTFDYLVCINWTNCNGRDYD